MNPKSNKSLNQGHAEKFCSTTTTLNPILRFNQKTNTCFPADSDLVNPDLGCDIVKICVEKWWKIKSVYHQIACMHLTTPLWYHIKLSKIKKYCSTVFENPRKSLLLHCRAKRATFTFWGYFIKNAKNGQFGEFLKTWSFRSNNATNFSWTKIASEFQTLCSVQVVSSWHFFFSAE